MAVYESILDLIGHTPLFHVKNIDTGPCELFLKLETYNPSGSIKDRIALGMIEAAERTGQLRPGGTVVEATAGNTGVGLCLVARAKGYKTLIVMPDKMSRDKVLHLRALGAEVIITRSDVQKGHPDYYQDKAEAITASLSNACYIHQFGNLANPEAHAKTTGPEIWSDMNHDIDAFVAGIGTGGTLTGVGHFLRQHHPQVELILADPEGSMLAEYVNHRKHVTAGSWLVEGIGEDFIPSICDLDILDEAISVSDKDSFCAARTLLKNEGILAGPSSGTLLHAALTYCRRQTQRKRVVTLVCDSGSKYWGRLYNDAWMSWQGFLPRSGYGDLRDWIPYPVEKGLCMMAQPSETMARALHRMNMYDLSQLPVVREKTLVGWINAVSMLGAHPQGLQDTVDQHMTSAPCVLDAAEDIQILRAGLAKHGAVAILHEQRFCGVITPLDIVNKKTNEK